MKQAIQVTDSVYWVGVRDINKRFFHGELFPVDEGTTYNAYLVVDEITTLFDTVEDEFMDECIERIQSVLKDRPLDRVILQHAEPDHASGLQDLLDHYPNIEMYASVGGVKNIKAQFGDHFDIKPLKTGDTMNTGRFDYEFVEMQMIHWPDNLLTYCPQVKTIFSNDAFGQHIINFKLTDEGLDKHMCLEATKEYFANIVIPYTKQVKTKLDLILSKNWAIDYIMPAHGIIWKDYITDVINAYMDYATLKNSHKAIIVFETVWAHTQEIAETLAEGFAAGGLNVKIYKLSETRSSLVFRELIDADVIAVGTGTYNNGLAYSVAAFLEHLRTSKLTGKKGLAFGAYGWFPNVQNQLEEKLKEAGLDTIDPPAKHQFTPKEGQLEQYYELAKSIAESL